MQNENGLNLKPKFIPRQQRLNAWLVERGITRQQLAQATGLSVSFIGKVFSGQKTPKKRIDQLINLGIPAELLPEPGTPKKRGPKPKECHDPCTTEKNTKGDG